MMQSFPLLLFLLMRTSASVKHAERGSPAWKEENAKCKNAAGIPEKGSMRLRMSRKDSDQDHVLTSVPAFLCRNVFWNDCSLLFSLRCQCQAQFEGPECQQNKHSFHGNGYAWFPPMMPCFESHVSLEFITDVAEGLLLYSGPLAQLQAWDHEDFMALGMNSTKTSNRLRTRSNLRFPIAQIWISDQTLPH